MKGFLGLLLFLGVHVGINGQQAQVNGRVFGPNGPIEGAQIQLIQTVRGAQSKEDGSYVIKALPAGTYRILSSHLEFGKQEKTIQLAQNEVQEVNFELKGGTVLGEVSVWDQSLRGNGHLEEVHGYTIAAAKKNELILLKNTNANLAMNNSRQIFSRTPGISVWENDGSGIQLGVAARGLSPNRSWEFNVRMNGYDITPDPMGYPEAYYTPPMEVVERIEIIRGASAIQYGPQFGGLMNFILRKPDASKKISVLSQQTLGSFGMLSSFNYVGGTEGKWSYTFYYQKRRGDGWRENSYFNTDHSHLELSYALSNRIKLGADLTYMFTESQQGGGLSDAQFAINPRQSIRARNWMSNPWFIPALHADVVINTQSKLNFKAFSTIAERNSVGYTKAITLADDGKNRQVDRDYYTTLGMELRYLLDYQLLGKKNTLATGIRWHQGHIDRKQLGIGSAGADMDFRLAQGTYPRDLDFQNQNQALFAENVIRLDSNWLITAGLRLENIQSRIQGKFSENNSTAQNLAETHRTRRFLLASLGMEYHINPQHEVYGNASQAYRPVLISDLTPPATTDVIDPKLSDAKGYSLDLGIRGKWGNVFQYDINYFFLNYQNRIGTITLTNPDGSPYQFRSNLGTSHHQGLEAYLEAKPFLHLGNAWSAWSFFASLAYINAQYTDFLVRQVQNGNLVEENLKGNQVENAPRKINRWGINYRFRNLSFTWQLSDVGASFADARNTVLPNAAGTTGKIPGYVVQDFSGQYLFKKHYVIKAGVNNVSNAHYFTRRAGGYPGPGLLPAEGRSFYVSFGIKW